jgi:hypothetical protein
MIETNGFIYCITSKAHKKFIEIINSYLSDKVQLYLIQNTHELSGLIAVSIDDAKEYCAQKNNELDFNIECEGEGLPYEIFIDYNITDNAKKFIYNAIQKFFKEKQ